MRALFYSIEQFGWSNINFIIEFRNTSDERNVYLESMLETIVSDRVGEADIVDLSPLNGEELFLSVNETFQDDADFVTKTLLARTGGNCFFIDQLDTSKNSDFGSLRYDLTVPARLTVVFPGVFALA